MQLNNINTTNMLFPIPTKTFKLRSNNTIITQQIIIVAVGIAVTIAAHK